MAQCLFQGKEIFITTDVHLHSQVGAWQVSLVSLFFSSFFLSPLLRMRTERREVPGSVPVQVSSFPLLLPLLLSSLPLFSSHSEQAASRKHTDTGFFSGEKVCRQKVGSAKMHVVKPVHPIKVFKVTRHVFFHEEKARSGGV